MPKLHIGCAGDSDSRERHVICNERSRRRALNPPGMFYGSECERQGWERTRT